MILAAQQLNEPDYIVLAGYFALMLGIGIYFYRYMKGMKDYFSGGNRIPWWLSGVSFYMSSFSAFAFVGYSTMAYKYGWVAVTLFWTAVPATLVSVVFFSRKWRRARIDSPVEYLELRYNRIVRQLFAWEGIPVKIIDDALKLVAIGIVVTTALGLGEKGLTQCILWSGLIILTYTLLGGLWAVVVTDFVQFVIMAIAVVLLVPLAVSAAGGMTGVFNDPPSPFFQLTHSPQYDGIYVVSFLLLMILAYSSINWSLIQRYYCVPTEKDSVKMGYFVMILFVVGPPLILLPALLAPEFISLSPGEDKMIYPLICMKLLPTGLMGLIIAAMFAATMSMLSSDYNVCAAVLTNDVFRRLFRPGASQKELVLVGRLMTLLIGVVSLVVALAMRYLGGEDLFRGMVKLFSIFTAPVAIPMMLGLLFRKMNKNGALAAFLAGAALGLLLFFLLKDEMHWGDVLLKKETILLFSTTILTTGVMIAVSLLFPPSPNERKQADLFFHRLSVSIGRMEQDLSGDDPHGLENLSPFRVVRVSSADRRTFAAYSSLYPVGVALWAQPGYRLALTGVRTFN